jgi:hypothetical protein
MVVAVSCAIMCADVASGSDSSYERPLRVPMR